MTSILRLPLVAALALFAARAASAASFARAPAADLTVPAAPASASSAPLSLPAPLIGAGAPGAISAAELQAVAAPLSAAPAAAARVQAASIVQAVAYAAQDHLQPQSSGRLYTSALKRMLASEPGLAERDPALAQLRAWRRSAGGAELDVDADGVYVAKVQPGSDAAAAGLAAGQRVLDPDGGSTKGATRATLARWLDRGEQDRLDFAVAAPGKPAPTRVQVAPRRERWTRLFAAYLARLPAERVESAASAALNGIAARLDRFSRYEPPDRHRTTSSELHGQGSRGLGLIFEADARTVAGVAPGSSAEAAGLAPGDVVLQAGGYPLDGSPQTLRAAMRAETDAPVAMTYRRGRRVRTVPLVPGRVHFPTARVVRLAGDVAYMRIQSFEVPTDQELWKALLEGFRGVKPRGVIIDVRFNPGGSIDAADKIAGWFARGEVPLARVRERGRSYEQAFGQDGPLAGTPVAVLIDEQTISASELLAMELKDGAGAVVVGRRSWGKPFAQRSWPLPNGGAMTVTYRRAEGARGSRVDGETKGLAPDVVVRQTESSRRDSLRRLDAVWLGRWTDLSSDDVVGAALAALARR